MTVAAVITGDLVRSRRSSADDIAQAIATLQKTATGIETATRTALGFYHYRGDGWQVHVADPGQALRTAVLLHAGLRTSGLRIDTRIAIGIGPVKFTRTRALADATGDAFIASGNALENMGKSRLAIDGKGVGPSQQAIVALVEHIIFGWTANQAEATALMLMHPDFRQEDIAQKLSITRQAVQLRLAGAGAAAISAACSAFARHSFAKAAPS